MRRAWTWLVAATLAGAGAAGCSTGSGGHPSLPSTPGESSTSVQIPTSIRSTTTSSVAPATDAPTTATTDRPVAVPTSVPVATTSIPDATTAPTADAPTTAVPTTAAPTTSPPTSSPPTTASPATIAPSTVAPAIPVATTVAVATASSGGAPWGWIIALLVVAALAALIALLVHRNTRAKAIGAWQRESEPAVDSAHLTLSLLPASGQDITDRGQWAAVRQRVEEAAQLLDRAAGRAPTDDEARAADRSAETLRGLGFALESNLLLREAPVPPTAAQLADADVTARQRRIDAETALGEMDRAVGRNGAGAPA